MAPNACRVDFSVRHFVHIITHTTQKLKVAIVIQERFTYQTIALLLEISIILVRAVCEIQSASYGFKHASKQLCGMSFVRTYTLNLKTTGCMWTFYILNDCSTIADIYFLC